MFSFQESALTTEGNDALQDEKKQLKALRAEFEARGRQVDRLKAQLAGNNGDTPSPEPSKSV